MKTIMEYLRENHLVGNHCGKRKMSKYEKRKQRTDANLRVCLANTTFDEDITEIIEKKEK